MDINFPDIPIPRSLPEQAFDSLTEQLQTFQQRISDDSEVGIVAAGGQFTLHIERLRCDGQMIVFDGIDEQQRRSRLIQHYTQIAVQMVEVPKLDDTARRIGF